MPNIDPWTAAPVGRSGDSKKKTARLAGKEEGAKKVHVLIKLHDWASRAIYLYNLAMADTEPPERRMRRIDKPSDEVWNMYSQMGLEVPHHGGKQATDVSFWVNYGREQA